MLPVLPVKLIVPEAVNVPVAVRLATVVVPVRVGAALITNVVPVPVWDAIEVAFPELVIGPVRFALVVTLPTVRLAAVPVILVPTRAVGVPKAGVTNVGLVAKTNAPEPVSSDITPAN